MIPHQVTEHGVAQSHCLRNGLHRNRPFLDVGIAIEIGGGSCSERPVIVLDPPMEVCRIFLSGNTALASVPDAEKVLALAENLAEREGDGTWIDTCRGNLIDKWRELMEVVLVNQHHLQVCIAEIFCQTKTTESATLITTLFN